MARAKSTDSHFFQKQIVYGQETSKWTYLTSSHGLLTGLFYEKWKKSWNRKLLTVFHEGIKYIYFRLKML